MEHIIDDTPVDNYSYSTDYRAAMLDFLTAEIKYFDEQAFEYIWTNDD